MNICVQKIPLLFIACMLIACACSSAEEVILSGIDTDVRLSKLVISDSDDPNSPDLDMIPVFDPQQTRYSASEVAQSVFITAACFNPNAKLYINGQEVPQDRMYEVPLLVDTNPIKIDVRVSKGSYTGTKTYTLDFTRVSDNNSSLIGIFPSIGTLDKAFYYGTFDYAISVPFSATSISLTAIAAGGKTVGIRYMLGAALVDSQNIDLTAGGTALYEGNTTVISIHTAARGENSSSIYTVSVTRAVPRTGNAILSFTFENLPSEQERLVCKIDDPIKLITGRMVYLTNADNTRYDGRPNRLPVIEVSPGARISTNASVAQDFTSDVLYTVTAENGVSVTYTVRIASSSPYPIIALLYTTASGTRNILNGEEIDIGNATRGETKSFAVTLSNAGYVDLELSNCTIAAEGGWGIATPLGQITTNLAPKAVRAVMMNLNPTEFEGIGTVLTLTSDNPEVPDFSVDISAYVYDTVVNNLLISEWAQTYGSGNAECYIELRNYSDHAIVVDNTIVVRSEAVSNKTYTLSQYARYSDGNTLARYKSFSAEPLVLDAGKVIIIIQRGTVAGVEASKFFDADFLTHTPSPDMICALVTKTPSTGMLIVTGERLETARAYVSKGTTSWGHTPTPTTGSHGGFSGTGGTYAIYHFKPDMTSGTSASAQAAQHNKWAAFGYGAANRKAGLWPK